MCVSPHATALVRTSFCLAAPYQAQAFFAEFRLTPTGTGRSVDVMNSAAMPCCRPADLPAGARAEVLELHKDSTLIRCPVIERVPFIKKVTPRAPTKPNNAEAG